MKLAAVSLAIASIAAGAPPRAPHAHAPISSHGSVGVGTPSTPEYEPASDWTAHAVIGAYSLSSIGCASTTTCYATGETADLGTGADPIVVPVTNGIPEQVQNMDPGSGRFMLAGDVGCPTPTTCYITGTTSLGTPAQGTITVLNGGTVSGIGTSDVNPVDSLGAIDCVTTDFCYATGHGIGTLAGANAFEPIQDGLVGTWSQPNPWAGGWLFDLSCATTSICIGAGGIFGSNGAEQGFIEALDENHVDNAYAIAGTTEVSGISCPSSATCYALATTSGGGQELLTISLLGSTDVQEWPTEQLIVTASEQITSGVFNAISCPQGQSCLLAGYVLILSRFQLIEAAAVATAVNGQPGLAMTVAGASDLYDIACTATTCDATGINTNSATWPNNGIVASMALGSATSSGSQCNRQFVFVHGIHGNYVDVNGAITDSQSSDPNFASVLYSLHELCPLEPNVHAFAYYHDLGYATNSTTYPCDTHTKPADLNVGPLYLDPGSGTNSTCDGNAALALDATALDDYITSIRAAHPGEPITVLANSMGGAVVRGWLRLAQSRGSSDLNLSVVDSVIFLEGAQQGSIWAGLAEKPWFKRLYGVLTAIPVLGGALEQLDLSPNRAGIKDLAPQSDWYNEVNSQDPPSGLAYFNFAANIQLNVNVAGFWPWDSSTNYSDQLGDFVMMPGSNDPTAEPAHGGEDFLPGGDNTASIHQFILNDAAGTTYNINLDWLSSQATWALITLFGDFWGPLIGASPLAEQQVLSNPTNHFAFPSNTGIGGDKGGAFVNSCTGPGSQTPTAAIVAIVANPKDACP